MKLSDVKLALEGLPEVRFVLPNGGVVPPHFHVTEVGQVTKHFIDCGGTVRKERVINFQLFTAADYDHRLSAKKLKAIIELSEKVLQLSDHEIEVEYQGETIGKYGLTFFDGQFHLTPTQTDCLAKDKCGIPSQKPNLPAIDLKSKNTSCTPGAGCC